MKLIDSIKKKFGFYRAKGIILYYHRVLPTVEEDVLELAVSEANFRNQLAYLGKHFDVVSLEQLLKFVSSGFDSSRNKIVITFDDGYVDNLVYAAPILEKFNYPAVFFVAVDFVENIEHFWWECVDWTRDILKDENIVHKLRKMKEGARSKYITDNKLEKSPLNPDISRPMTWDELTKLSKNFTIGSHTCSHSALTSLSSVEMQKELVDSKEILEKKLNQPINFFSYPYGEKDFFNERTEQKIVETGYACALTTIPQSVNTHDSLFRLGRVVVKNENGKSLVEKIQKIFDLS